MWSSQICESDLCKKLDQLYLEDDTLQKDLNGNNKKKTMFWAFREYT